VEESELKYVTVVTGTGPEGVDLAAGEDVDAEVAAAAADEVVAAPNGLCAHYCRFLGHCEPGMAHVRMHHGEDALEQRLAIR